jgi:hypothetical protein
MLRRGLPPPPSQDTDAPAGTTQAPAKTTVLAPAARNFSLTVVIESLTQP